MPDELKGLVDIYNKVCNELAGEDFIEWVLDASDGFAQGMFCETIAWYVKKDRWYLEEDNYEPTNEASSTWFARKLVGDSPPSPLHNVMRFFNLEKGERLITTNSKKRPVILLRNSIDDWWNPSSTIHHENNWLCLPIFTYKPRHDQDYVINDLKLENPDRFYIPTFYNDKPGIKSESAARFQAIQMVKEEHLTPSKLMCTVSSHDMERPFKLSKVGMRLVMYHFYKHLEIFNELEDPDIDYSLFKSVVKDLIDAAEIE